MSVGVALAANIDNSRLKPLLHIISKFLCVLCASAVLIVTMVPAIEPGSASAGIDK